MRSKDRGILCFLPVW